MGTEWCGGPPCDPVMGHWRNGPFMLSICRRGFFSSSTTFFFSLEITPPCSEATSSRRCDTGRFHHGSSAPPTPAPGFIRLFKASAARRRSGPHSPHQMALWGLRRNDPIFLTITVLNYRCLLRKCHYGGYHFGKKSGFPSSFLNGSS